MEIIFGKEHQEQIERIDATCKVMADALISLLKGQKQMALDLSKLNAGAAAAEAKIAALNTENADLKTQLAAAIAKQENPADQTAIDGVGDALTTAAAAPTA